MLTFETGLKGFIGAKPYFFTCFNNEWLLYSVKML